MAPMLIPILVLGMLCTPASSICVHTPPLEFKADTAAGVGNPACTGFLQTNNGRSICGYISSPSAERACHELGLNFMWYQGRWTKIYRCNSGVHTTDVVTPTLPTPDEYWVILKGQIDWDCDAGSPDCFLDCHTDVGNSNAGLLPTSACVDPFDTGIVCTDIDECKEGVIHDCVSGFDHECLIGQACGNNTICTNTEGAYICDCMDGFTGDPYSYNTTGCTDINECLTLPSPCVAPTEHCHNTIGSYICECPPDYVWNDTPPTPTCDPISNCPSLSNIDNADLSGSTYTCEGGYEPSYNDDYGIHIECRGDDYCHCSSASCVRKSCGVPPMDPNAETIKNDGLHESDLTYKCHPGFASEYTISCDDGVWGDPPSRCENINECLPTNNCPENSNCIDTIGSYHCDCHPGYEGPTCERISCGRIPEVDNAQRITHITEEYSQYEMTIEYRCEEGFRASSVNNPTDYEDSFSITCQLDKTWDHRPIPECIPIFCGDPGTVAYSTRYGDSFYYWEEVTYTCNNGFRPSQQTSNDDRQFRVRCEYDGGWDGRMTCVNVNECQELTKPCGVGDGHHCRDTVGSYTCICASKHRLDHTGRNCVPTSPAEGPAPTDPCAVFNALNFCHQGSCYVDDRNTPKCLCDKGYDGPFCNEDDRINLTLPYILALLALSIIGFCIIILIILSCYVCAKHHHDEVNCPPAPPPAYVHTPPKVVLRPGCAPEPTCPEPQQAPQQKYEVRYIAKQVPVNGANPVAALPQGTVTGTVYQQL